MLLELGEDLKVISDRLGHSTITLTANTYSHVREKLQWGLQGNWIKCLFWQIRQFKEEEYPLFIMGSIMELGVKEMIFMQRQEPLKIDQMDIQALQDEKNKYEIFGTDLTPFEKQIIDKYRAVGTPDKKIKEALELW